MIKLFDCHSHTKNSEVSGTYECIQVVSIDAMEVSKGMNFGKYFTFGLHPWNTSEASDIKTILDNNFFDSSHCLGLGEIGLDKLQGAPIYVQIEIFKQSLKFAKSQEIPTIVIHCVKAFSEVSQVLRDVRFNGKIIFHDYAGNLQIAGQLEKHADCFFSFGKSLFRKDEAQFKLLGKLPIEKILFETDDQDQFSIEDIYQKASAALGLNLEVLAEQIEKNFLNSFPKYQSIEKS